MDVAFRLLQCLGCLSFDIFSSYCGTQTVIQMKEERQGAIYVWLPNTFELRRRMD